MVSLILGSLSVILLFITLVSKVSFGIIPSVCAIVGLFLGTKNMKEDETNKSKIGVILCFVYILIFVIVAIKSFIAAKSMLP